MNIVLDAKPYAGRYDLDVTDFTTREWGWIKRLAGYLPLTVADGFGDPELLCVFAAIALRRAGRIENHEVPAVFDRLIDDPAFQKITLEVDDDVESVEGDAGPPSRSSNGSEPTSGSSSSPSSASPATPQNATGMPASATSDSDPPTLVT